MAKKVFKKLTPEQRKEKSDKAYSAIADNIIKLLEDGTIPWHKPWTVDVPFHNPDTGKVYSGINTLILAVHNMANGLTDPRFVGYKGAQKLGGQVPKGAKSVTIFAPIKVKGTRTNEEGEEEEYSFLKSMSTASVWNVESVGVNLPPIEAPTLKPNQAIEQAEQIVANMTNKPPIQHGGDRAFYTPALDAIKLPSIEQHDGSEEYYATLFHELVHSTGHKSRLNRHAEGIGDLHSGRFGSKGYAAEELVAEFGSAFLRADAGIIQGSIENSAAYIASWLKVIKDKPDIVQVAATAAVKAADYITGKRG